MYVERHLTRPHSHDVVQRSDVGLATTPTRHIFRSKPLISDGGVPGRRSREGPSRRVRLWAVGEAGPQ